MSESDPSRRRGIPANRRVNVPRHPSLSPSTSTATRRRSSSRLHRRSPRPSSNPIDVFERWSSEPALPGAGGAKGELGQPCLTSPEAEGVLCRSHTCTDIVVTYDYFSLPQSTWKSLEEYNKDAKVVINVTVEGSPGPVRAMVKLGSSVEDAIKLVLDKYREERRSPLLHKDAISNVELHHSYFSLECLDKADIIGDTGSRSFYLRKSCGYRSNNASLRQDRLCDGAGDRHPCPPLIVLQSFMSRKINKLIRRAHRLWKLLLCACVH